MIKVLSPRFFCDHCGGDHLTDNHSWSDEIETNGEWHAPLETPSHNGVYQGTVKVRAIAPGVSGMELVTGRRWRRWGVRKGGAGES